MRKTALSVRLPCILVEILTLTHSVTNPAQTDRDEIHYIRVGLSSGEDDDLRALLLELDPDHTYRNLRHKSFSDTDVGFFCVDHLHQATESALSRHFSHEPIVTTL